MNPGQEITIATDVDVNMAFACEDVSTDPFQRVSFHIIVDQINALTFPTQTPILFAVFGFTRKMAGFLMNCRVDVMPPSGDPIASQKIHDVAFRPDQLSQRAIVGFQGITWQKPGDYTFRFMAREHCMASFNLRIAQITPPATATGS